MLMYLVPNHTRRAQMQYGASHEAGNMSARATLSWTLVCKPSTDAHHGSHTPGSGGEARCHAPFAIMDIHRRFHGDGSENIWLLLLAICPPHMQLRRHRLGLA
mmetsp:Transcript_4692/g.12501  ORF Transcript_4692/g.12501 Transcript_4692/m.12501 type:complete len:103 (+) Transcript_4692:125-433(+)